MTLTYDFDIHRLFSEELFSDPKIGAMLNQSGFAPNQRGNLKALFRDPHTAAALRGADEAVKEVFLKAGFGMVVTDSGAGRGHYPAADGPMRDDILNRLSQGFEEADLSNAHWNGFDPDAFWATAIVARPASVDPAPVSAESWVPSVTRGLADPRKNPLSALPPQAVAMIVMAVISAMLFVFMPDIMPLTGTINTISY